MDTKSRRQGLISEIAGLEQTLTAKKKELDNLIRSCPHKWGRTISDPIYRPGYHSPGDPVGTMGVDRRLPMDIPSSTTPRWKRTCEICGHTEETTRSADRVTQEPRF